MLNLDQVIVFGLLALTLIVGLVASRDVKDIREYAVGHKTYSTSVLALIFLATNIDGASALGEAASNFAKGVFVALLMVFGLPFTLAFIALFLTPHIARFSECISMGDVMHKLYGRSSQLITGITGAISSVLMTITQLVGLEVISTSLGLPKGLGILLGAAGLILDAYGGLTSVCQTDILQTMVLVTVIPLVAILAVKEGGGIQKMLEMLPARKLAALTPKEFALYFTFFLVWGSSPLGLAFPATFQRLLIAKDPAQLRNQYLLVTFLDPLVRITVILSGLAGLILYHHTPISSLMPEMVHQLLPVGLKGVAIAALFTMVLSSASSYLHAAGVLTAHDVAAPIAHYFGLQINELRWARASTLLMGCIAALGAFLYKNPSNFSFLAMELTAPVLMFPLLAGMMGLKAPKRCFYISLVATIVALFLSNWLLSAEQTHLVLLFSVLVNGVTFFGSYWVYAKARE